jgi:hypothetical protein
MFPLRHRCYTSSILPLAELGDISNTKYFCETNLKISEMRDPFQLGLNREADILGSEREFFSINPYGR